MRLEQYKIKIGIIILLFFSVKATGQGGGSSMSFVTPFEFDNNYSASYEEVIAHYEALANTDKSIQIMPFGETDSGYPLHCVVLSDAEDIRPEVIRQAGKGIVMIMNGIHPGESCGVDASMMLARDIILESDKQQLLDRLVIVIIPVYNVGGSLNRRPHSRANQVGPMEQGFRGNALNLDLNRDFIKADSRNAQTFNRLFTYWNPDVFVDTHTSNGADYPYTMTLLETQHNKLAEPLSNYLRKRMSPRLYSDMERAGWEMCPYVNVRNTPDDGIMGFMDLPRYSTGYASLFNCLGFMTEAHMLKSFEDRVRSTYSFLGILLKVTFDDLDEIRVLRSEANKIMLSATTFALNWEPAYEQAETITFKGYTAGYKASEVSGLDRLYYDRDKPYIKDIPYLNTFKPSIEVEKPIAYLIPQAYKEVIERLSWNGVELARLSEDQKIFVEMYKILDFETPRNPYEGHYLHSEVKLETFQEEVLFRKGDYVVYANQFSNQYIIHTLEPQGADSYFTWNFFDGILGQKEYFSSYVFEETAASYLAANPSLRQSLEERRLKDEEFAASGRAQLDYIYKRSPYYEPTHRLYPVGRIKQQQQIKTDQDKR